MTLQNSSPERRYWGKWMEMRPFFIVTMPYEKIPNKSYSKNFFLDDTFFKFWESEK